MVKTPPHTPHLDGSMVWFFGLFTACSYVRAVVWTPYDRLFVSQFGSKLKGNKTQAFQKLNQKLSKLKDFVPSKLNFSENLSSLDARNEFLCNKKQINLGRNSTKH